MTALAAAVFPKHSRCSVNWWDAGRLTISQEDAYYYHHLHLLEEKPEAERAAKGRWSGQSFHKNC